MDRSLSHKFTFTKDAPTVTLQIPLEVIQVIKDFMIFHKQGRSPPCFSPPQDPTKYEHILFQLLGETENGTEIRWTPEFIVCGKYECKGDFIYSYSLRVKLNGEFELKAFVEDDNLIELVEYLEVNFLDGSFFAIDNSEAIKDLEEWELVLDGWGDLVKSKRNTRNSGTSRLSSIL